jgi:hypothetical protein
MNASWTIRPIVETLEDRNLPSVTLPTLANPGPVIMTGTDANDSFVVRALPSAGPTSTELQFSDDGGDTWATVEKAAVTGVQVYGLGGDDTLTLDFNYGFVGKTRDSGGLPVYFDGGDGSNQLVLQG